MFAAGAAEKVPDGHAETAVVVQEAPTAADANLLATNPLSQAAALSKQYPSLLRDGPRVERNAAKLLDNIRNNAHETTPTLFAETPTLGDHVWYDWNGHQHWHRSPLTIAACYNDTWLVEYLVTHTDCDMGFVEVCIPDIGHVLTLIWPTGLVAFGILRKLRRKLIAR